VGTRKGISPGRRLTPGGGIVPGAKFGDHVAVPDLSVHRKKPGVKGRGRLRGEGGGLARRLFFFIASGPSRKAEITPHPARTSTPTWKLHRFSICGLSCGEPFRRAWGPLTGGPFFRGRGGDSPPRKIYNTPRSPSSSGANPGPPVSDLCSIPRPPARERRSKAFTFKCGLHHPRRRKRSFFHRQIPGASS